MTTTSSRPREVAGNDRHDERRDVAKNPHLAILESVMRVSLAGFGGALVGLSLARRGRWGVGGVAGILVQPSVVSRRAASYNAAAPAAVAATTTTTTTAAAGVGNRASRMAENGGGATTTTTTTSTTAIAGGGKARLRRQRTIIRTTPPTAAGPTSNDRELPTAWAVACAAFAGVVEFARITSPSTAIRDIVAPYYYHRLDGMDVWGGTSRRAIIVDDENDDDGRTSVALDLRPPPPPTTTTTTTTADTTGGYPPDASAACAVFDYAIGGAVAGAIFRGSAVRTRATSRFDASSPSSASAVGGTGRGALMSGALSGAALGLSAGIFIFAIDRVREMLDERFGGDYDDDATAYYIREGSSHAEDDGGIPVDIRMMSNEELAKSIDSLRRNNDGGGGSSKITATTMTISSSLAVDSDERGDVRDFFAAIGFRPHPSRDED
ncbi:hypothetical protein ACHAXA_003263 [Cyclostephanos tholiformis]|uniref:Uncharacterized protein n=1 Tax=Cyclostephanos tholiformis TaxID=382380 RepID=A0ABD3SB28_9STRA